MVLVHWCGFSFNRRLLDLYFLFCKTSVTGPARVFFKVFSITYLVYGGSLALACCYFVLAFFGTIYRALIISHLVMPYIQFLLYFASVNSTFARKKLDNFDEFRSGFLKWLRIPSIREVLCGFAVLSTNSAEPAVKDSKSENKKSDDQGHGMGQSSPRHSMISTNISHSPISGFHPSKLPSS